MPNLSVVLIGLVVERMYLRFYAGVFLSASISDVQEAYYIHQQHTSLPPHRLPQLYDSSFSIVVVKLYLSRQAVGIRVAS